MLPYAEAKPVHARWSDANRDFLDFVERNPSCLHRSTFGSIYEDPSLRKLSIQPWPLFAGESQQGEIERVTLGISRIVKGSVDRFLHGDPGRVIEFYRSNTEDVEGSEVLVLRWTDEVLDFLLKEPDGIWGAPSRGDYIETEEGLKCLEFNAGSFIGGLPTQHIGERVLESPEVARFLRERGLAARAPRTVGALMRHLFDDTVRLGIWKGGEFNVAILGFPHEPAQAALNNLELYNREFRRVLVDTGLIPDGRVFLCSPADVVEDGEVMRVEGHPLHAAFELHDGTPDMRPLFFGFKQKRVNLFSGPITALMGDKRNLALVSENAGSDEFTAEERALIERHVPWTRRVLPGKTTFRGRPFRLAEDLVDHRADLVLKKATSMGGAHVHIGRYRTDDEWKRVISQALVEEDWVVQEYLETIPYWFQTGESGAAPHHVIWGLFAFGDHFGGAFLRMQRIGAPNGVVNTRQGAEVGAYLEITG